MAIHPLGLITIDGTDRDRAIINASLDNILARGTSQWCGYSFAWMSCILARCNRPELALDMLEKYQRGFILRNGFHCNGDQSGENLSSMTYRPFTLEGNFLAMQAVQEMLLQSWGNVVRVFPAVSDRWQDVSFKDLRAEGGYKVTAARKDGRTFSVSITPTYDSLLTLRLPPGEKMKWSMPKTTAPNGDVRVHLRAGESLEGTSLSHVP